MASTIRLLIRTDTERHKFNHLTTLSTLYDLKMAIFDKLKIAPDDQALLVGRPPKELSYENEQKQSLPVLGITSGTMIIVRDSSQKKQLLAKKDAGLVPSTVKKTTAKAVSKRKKPVEAKTIDKIALSEQFRIGEKVKILGVRDKTFNGQTAEILEYHPSINRWEVVIEGQSAEEDGSIYFGPDVLHKILSEEEKRGFTDILQGTKSAMLKESNRILTTRKDWQALWKSAGLKEKWVRVDFTKYMVLGLFLGDRNRGGYAIEVTEVEDKGADIVCYYKITVPSVHQSVSGGRSAPFHLVRIPKTKKKISFRTRR